MTEAPATRSRFVPNFLSFDVEDYFHVSNFESSVPFETWENHESRIEKNTRRILEILEPSGIRATFFVLGWVADRFPSLVRSIAEAGHEIGTHSYRHRLIYTLTPEEFRRDLRLSIDRIEQASGKKVLGHRAPSFSITHESLWALDILQEQGLKYDSSIFPVWHDRYGIPGAPRGPFEICPGFLEFPLATIRCGFLRIPLGGGGYFRLYPYEFTKRGIQHLNRSGLPAVVYLHPWEFDPDQPRLSGSLQSRFRHYVNLKRTESRLKRLCRDFRFSCIGEWAHCDSGVVRRGTGFSRQNPAATRAS